MAREKEQISKIRELKKARNKKRNTIKAPPPKRRKLDEARHEKVNGSSEIGDNQNEKRKGEGAEEETAPARKKQKRNGDIRVMMGKEQPASPAV